MRITTAKRFISGLVVTILTCGGVASGEKYYVQPGDSLYTIAARYGSSVTALQKNNGLTTTQIKSGQVLKIAGTSSATTDSTTYTVRSGDSLLIIAKRYQVSLEALKEANNLSANYVTKGQRLTIPEPSLTHRIQSGESLYSIAQKYGITVKKLQEANLLSGASIQAGQVLTVPVSSNESSGANSITYIVKYGDPLYLIAKRYGVSLEKLLAANNLWSVSSVYPGQKLLIPQTSSESGGSDNNTGNNSGNNFNLSQSEIDLLARLVTAESEGEPFLGQVAVAATILNRLEDSRYPDTIAGIIYQVDNGSYQFSPVLDGRINASASSSAYQAVVQALSGSDPSNGANGFYNPDKTTNEWVRSQAVTAAIGDHVFFKY